MRKDKKEKDKSYGKSESTKKGKIKRVSFELGGLNRGYVGEGLNGWLCCFFSFRLFHSF